MKRTIFLFLLILTVLVSPVSAQETAENLSTEWTVLYQSDFSDPNQTIWPTGSDVSDTTTIVRSISDLKYQWSIQSADGQFSWLSFPSVEKTAGYQNAVSVSIQLPSYTPYACAGLMLNRQEDSFYSFLLCNDSSYGLLQYHEGTWDQKIPFSPLQSYEQDQSSTIRVEISNGWADFYLNGLLLDTYPMNDQNGINGIIVQPLTSDVTAISFRDIRLEEAPAKAQETVFADNVPDSISRILKMLKNKDRIDDIAGSFSSFPDQELSLAQMGYSEKMDLGISGQDYLLQSDISWKSAYEKPDFTNSGCGFIFRNENEYTFQRVYLSLDGNIYLSAFRNGTEIPIMTYNYGTWSLQGEGTLTLVADQAKISILYNENLLGTIHNASWMADGSTGLVVQSGTNFDFGTSCTFKNNQMYVLN
jgi:hypothetical protein